MRELDEHRGYLSDVGRLEAYQRALAEVVDGDSVVLDLGAGTGVLGILAARAGATRVYAVDRGPILDTAARIAADNGCPQVVPVRGGSAEVELPEPATVVVADQMDPTGVRAGLLESFADAHARLLAPGAVAVPRALRLAVAPVSSAEAHAKVAFWRTEPFGLDTSAAAALVEHQLGWERFGVDQLVGPPVWSEQVATLTHGPRPVAIAGSSVAERDGDLHGLAVWFEAELSPSVAITSAPGAPDAVDRDHGYLPLAAPVAVTAGTVIGIDASVGAVVTWSVTVDGEAVGGVCSTMAGELLGTLELARRRPDHQPVLGRRGRVLARLASAIDAGADVAALRALVADELAPVAAAEGGPDELVDWALAILER